jgi:predicted acetyltransferase
MAAFRFIDPGPLIDGELELVTPDVKWVDALLAACSHPLSQNDPGAASMTRARALEWLRAAPGGHQNPDPHTGRVPSYNFWMRLRQVSVPDASTSPPRWGEAAPPVEIAGGLGLRIGSTYDLEMYLGHIGYNVYPPARGNHYAERSCRLLLNIARAHGMKRLWITCNPDNWASRRTCERLGCTLAQIIPVPSNHPLYQRGDREKCRYWLDL